MKLGDVAIDVATDRMFYLLVSLYQFHLTWWNILCLL